MLLSLSLSQIFMLGGLAVNLISIIVLISKLGIFIGTVNESIKQHEKRINTLESHIFTRRSTDNI